MNDSVWLSKLIDKVLKRSDLRGRLTRLSITASVPFSKPFITIAREPGSGGDPIGQLVARRLGFRFYDTKLVDEIAKSSKLRKDVLTKIDERGRSAVQDFIQGMLNPNYVSDVAFVRYLTNVVVTLAYQGDVVILGRGANFITPRDKGLHVRITAPRSIRIERAVKYEHLSLAKAKEVVREVEADRREFVKQYFGEDIRKSEHYDLSVNTGYLSVEQSAQIIVNAFEQKFGRQQIF